MEFSSSQINKIMKMRFVRVLKIPFFLVLAVSLVCMLLAGVATENAQLRAIDSAEDSALEQSHTLNALFDGYFLTLEAYAGGVSAKHDINFKSPDTLVQLAAVKRGTPFLEMFIIDAEGCVYSSSGEIFADAHTMLTSPNLGAGRMILRSDADHVVDTEHFSLSVPLVVGGRVVGTAAAAFSPSDIRNAITSNAFSSAGYTFICDGDGNVVISIDESMPESIPASVLKSLDNGVDTENVGRVICSVGGESICAAYAPISASDFTLFYAVPDSYINELVSETSSLVYWTACIVILISIALLIYIYYTEKRSRDLLENEKQKLSKNTLELDLLIRSTPGGVFKYSADADERFEFISDNMLRLLGYTHDEFTQKFQNRFSLMVYEEDRARVLREIDTQIESSDFDSCEYRVEKGNGELIWVHDEGHIATDDAGKRSFYVVIVDITAQKRTEAALKEKNDENAIVISQSGKSVIRYDIASHTATHFGDITRYLDISEVMTNYPQSLFDLHIVSDNSVDALETLFDSIKSGIPTGRCDVSFYTKSGENRWLHADYTTIFDANGSPSYSILSVFDNTDSFEKELAYEKLKSELSSSLAESVAYCEANITNGTIERVIHRTVILGGIDATRISLPEYIEMANDTYTVPEDAALLTEFFAMDRLHSLYARGVHEDSIAYRSTLEGDAQWYRTVIQMVKYPYSDDVKGFIVTTNINSERLAMEHLEELAYYDSMTHLLNRATFERRIRAALSELEDGDMAALFMLDLDFFKKVNDTLGHQAGDEILKKTAAALSAQFRETDAVGRLGGDEFVAFIPRGATAAILKEKAAALTANISFSIGSLIVTTSVGAILCDKASRTLEQLLADVDAALYRAKSGGKNQYFIGASSGAAHDEPVAIETSSDISQAIQLSTLFEYMDGGILIADVRDKVHVTYVSPSFYKAMGYTDQPHDSNAWMLSKIYPPDVDMVLDTFKAAAKGDTRDCVYRAGNDGELWRQLRAAKLSELDGGGASIIGMITDITVLKTSEMKLSIAEQRYRLATEQTNAMIWEVDIKTHTLYQSLETSMSLGHRSGVYHNVPDALIATGTIHQDSIDEFRHMYSDLYAGVEGKTYIILSKNDSNGYVWLRASFRILRDEHGMPIRAIGVVEPQLNINAEMRAFRDEQRFASLVKPSLINAFTVNLSKDIIESTGMRYNAHRSEYAENVYAPDRDGFLAASDSEVLIKSYDEGRIWHTVEYRRMETGQPRWTNLSYNLIRHPVSSDIYAFVYSRDIEARKEWELSLSVRVDRDNSTFLYTRDAFAAVSNSAINKLADDESCAVTVFELANVEKIKANRGMESLQKYLSTIGRLCQFVMAGNVIAGQLDETHIAFFRLGMLNDEQQYGIVTSYMNRIKMLLSQALPDMDISLICGFSVSAKGFAKYETLLEQALVALDAARQMPDKEVALYMPKDDSADNASGTLSDVYGLYELRFQQQANLLRLAERDELTGLYSRHAFYRRARAALNAGKAASYVIMRWDIDSFKVFNDANGIEAGDSLLKDIALVAMEHFGNSGLCARIEADHYVCFDEEGARTPEDLLKTLTDSLSVYRTGFKVTFHIGVYRIVEPSLDISIMCDRALLALRSVKGSFTKRIAYYDEALRSKLIDEQELSGDMVSALEHREFKVFFQPQYNYDTGEMIGAEALVRWQHPTRGLVSPGVFIPLFERNGFISTLDEYVWRESCRCIRRWLDCDYPRVPVSVNISRIDLYDANLCDKFESLVHEYKLPFSMLHLEITESAYMQNPEQLVNTVKRLRELGFTIEMDDFGSGYSSLNTLKDVPVDMLKLDAKFITAGCADPRGGNILSSVIRMAHWLKLPVLAEGIETKEQADYLKTLNCFYMQGYYFAKPMPTEQFESVLRSSKAGTMDRYRNVDLNDMAEFWNPAASDIFDTDGKDGGVCILDYSGNDAEIVRAGDAFFKEIGITREQYADRFSHVLESFDPESRATFKAMLDETVRTGQEASCIVCNMPFTLGEKPVKTLNHARVLGHTVDRYPIYVRIQNITE